MIQKRKTTGKPKTTPLPPEKNQQDQQQSEDIARHSGSANAFEQTESLPDDEYGYVDAPRFPEKENDPYGGDNPTPY